MGAYLSAPITKKETHEDESAEFVFGVAAMQGWRTEMEDAHAVSLRVPSSKKSAAAAAVDEKGKQGTRDKKGGDGDAKPESDDSDDDSVPTAFFAVFDGHGGKEVAKYAAEHMVEEIAAAPALAAARKVAAAAAASTESGCASDDNEATIASLASAPLPQSGPLPDAASQAARLLAATLESAYLSTDVRVCAPEARRELAAFAAGGRDDDEEEEEEEAEEEIGRGGRGDVASRAGTALSLLLGGRGGGGGGGSGGGGSGGSGGGVGASVGGLSPATVAALAEAGVQVRVARARRLRLEVEEDEEGEEEEGEEAPSSGDDDGGGDSGEGKKKKNKKKKGKKTKKKSPAASAQRPPHSHRTHATLDVEETEEVTFGAAAGGGSGSAAGPAGAAKRKRPAALLAAAAAKEEEEEATGAADDDDAAAAASGNSSACEKAVGVKGEEEDEEEEEIEEMEADGDGDEEEEESEDDDDEDDDDDERPLPFSRGGGGGLAGLFGGGNRGPPARLPDNTPTTEYDPALGGRYIGPSAGCTAVSALVRGDQLAVANAGDSRAVLCRGGGVALPLTRDHKPTEEPELGRILAAGGFVADGRVNGSLNLSRALGDAEHKQTPGLPPQAQAVTCAPDLATVSLLPGDEFLLLCCDGIWDVLTCQEAVDFVGERLHSDGMSPAEAAAALCDRCLAPDTGGCGKGCDNMSAMVVVLKKFAPPEVVIKIKSAAAARAGKRPQSASGPALAKKKG